MNATKNKYVDVISNRSYALKSIKNRGLRTLQKPLTDVENALNAKKTPT